MTILWPNFDWGKNVFVHCAEIGKNCLKAKFEEKNVKLCKLTYSNFTREIAQFCSVTKFDDISGMKVFKKWPMIDESSILGIPELLESLN